MVNCPSVSRDKWWDWILKCATAGLFQRPLYTVIIHTKHSLHQIPNNSRRLQNRDNTGRINQPHFHHQVTNLVLRKQSIKYVAKGYLQYRRFPTYEQISYGSPAEVKLCTNRNSAYKWSSMYAGYKWSPNQIQIPICRRKTIKTGVLMGQETYVAAD